MKRIKLTAILLAFLCFLTACGTSAGRGGTRKRRNGTDADALRGGDSGGGGRGGMTTANDTDIQQDEVMALFDADGVPYSYRAEQ